MPSPAGSRRRIPDRRVLAAPGLSLPRPRDSVPLSRPRGNSGDAQQTSMARWGMTSRPASRCRADPCSAPRSGPRPPASLYVAGPFSMGYVDFFTFLIPLYGLSLGLDAARDRHPGRGAIDPRPVPVDPYRRLDGPVRHARGHARLRLDRDAAGAAVSAGAQLLGPVAAAARQRRGRWLCLVGSADPDRPACRGRCAVYRQVQLFRPARLDLGADRRRGGVGFRRRVAGLSARDRMGRGADRHIAADAGGRHPSCRNRLPAPTGGGSGSATSGPARPTISTRSC